LVRRGLLLSFCAPCAGFSVSYQHRNCDASWRRQSCHSCTSMWPVGVMEPLLLLRPLRLVPMILEPNFHLCWRQTYDARKVLSLRGRQISLLSEPPLQLVRLRLREQHPSLALFGVTGLRGCLTSRLLLSFRLLVILLSVQDVIFAFLPHEWRPHDSR